jgi:Fe-S-cluster containining protein
VLALGFHADYACRHSGRCCGTAWDVPVEATARLAIDAGMRDGRLPMLDAFAAGAPPAGYAAVLGKAANGACVWFDRDSRLCTVHARLGEGALPTTCRMFPRIARTGPRGVAITLSHYCPTAAAMLLRDGVALAVVEQPPAFPARLYEGLDADEWPPLLHPRMLMDDEAYEAWEAHVVWRCATVPSLWAALATVRRDAGALAAWQPGDGALLEAVQALRGARPVEAPVPDDAWVLTRVRDVLAVAPGADGVDDIPDVRAGFEALRAYEPAALRLVAAHAFGSWCAYQGRGLAAHVRSLETVAAVLVVEVARVLARAPARLDDEAFLNAVSATDFLLRHQASREGLAGLWSQREFDAGSESTAPPV